MIPQHTPLSAVPVWRESIRALPRTHATGKRILVDVAVIGGGLSGLSAAYHVLAAQPQAAVVVLEAQQIGHGASTRNSGMLTPGVGQNLGGLVRRFGADVARTMYLASLEAVQYVKQLTEREGINASLRMTGQLVIAHGRAGRRRLAQQAAMLRQLHLPYQSLTNGELRTRLEIGAPPAGSDHEGPAALRLPIAGILNPGRLLQGLSDAITRRGGKVYSGVRVESFQGEGPVRLRLADGQDIRARHVVIATSGYDAALNIQRGRLLPLHLRVLLSEPLTPAQLARLHWPGREGVIDSRRVFNYFRLTDDHRILFGGGRPQYVWGGERHDLPAAGADVERLIAAFRQFFPQLQDVPIARTWTGVIAYSLDTLPVVGPVAENPHVTFVGGWCGHGIALSILSGKWVQQMINSGKSPGELPWFRSLAPRVPTEIGRWTGIQCGGRAMEILDRL